MSTKQKLNNHLNQEKIMYYLLGLLVAVIGLQLSLETGVISINSEGIDPLFSFLGVRSLIPLFLLLLVGVLVSFYSRVFSVGFFGVYLILMNSGIGFEVSPLSIVSIAFLVILPHLALLELILRDELLIGEIGREYLWISVGLILVGVISISVSLGIYSLVLYSIGAVLSVFYLFRMDSIPLPRLTTLLGIPLTIFIVFYVIIPWLPSLALQSSITGSGSTSTQVALIFGISALIIFPLLYWSDRGL